MRQIPGADQPMLRGYEPPVEYNPLAQLQRDVDEKRAEIEREIEELRAILSRPRPRRTDD